MHRILPTMAVAATLLGLPSIVPNAEAPSPAQQALLMESADLLEAPANPDPDRLPHLILQRIEENNREVIFVSAAFPGIEGFIGDSWCFENDAIEFLDHATTEDGGVAFTYRVHDSARPYLLHTRVTPAPGALHFHGRIEIDSDGDAAPAAIVLPNVCYQVRRGERFRTDRSYGNFYPDFIARCFIFTEDGHATLDRLSRNPIPSREPDHMYNNPPWVQMYAPLGQYVASRQTGWADYSDDRFIIPVIGITSHDGAFVTALAAPDAQMVSQAWHDCVHNGSVWEPADAPIEERMWRLTVYAMENNPRALFQRAVSELGIEPLAPCCGDDTH